MLLHLTAHNFSLVPPGMTAQGRKYPEQEGFHKNWHQDLPLKFCLMFLSPHHLYMDTPNISCPVKISGGKDVHSCTPKSHYMRGNILKIYFTLFVAAAHLHKTPNITNVSLVNQHYSSTQQEQNIQYLFHHTNTERRQITPWVWISLQYLQCSLCKITLFYYFTNHS